MKLKCCTAHLLLLHVGTNELTKSYCVFVSDGSVSQLTEIALMEMFGVTAEEKDVKKITGQYE